MSLSAEKRGDYVREAIRNGRAVVSFIKKTCQNTGKDFEQEDSYKKFNGLVFGVLEKLGKMPTIDPAYYKAVSLNSEIRHFKKSLGSLGKINLEIELEKTGNKQKTV